MSISINLAFSIGMIYLFILIIILCLKKKLNKTFFNIILIFILVSLAEIFVFNMTSYRLFDREYTTKYFDDFKLNGITYDETTNKYKIQPDSVSYIELLDINCEVGTIGVDITGVDTYVISADFSDETTSDYIFWLTDKTMISNYKRTKYMPCILSGKVNKLKIYIKQIPLDTEFSINSVSVNENIPINIEFGRYIVMLAVVLSCYLLFRLDIFTKPYDSKNIMQNIIYLAVIIIFALLGIMNSNLFPIAENELNYTYSHDLVDSLIDKKPYLEIEVPDEIKELENPYDIGQRNTVGAPWDFALYNGRYYLYFGIVPAILFFTPYKILTGNYLPVKYVSKLMIVLFAVFLSLLIKRICMKYFKKIEYRVLIMCCIILQFSSLLLWITTRLLLYEFILLCGLTFSVIGLYFYFCAIKDDKKINYLDLFFSCLFLALAVGCRPTTLLLSLIIVPKLLSTFIKKCREKKVKDIIKLIISVGVPYICIGIGLMFYNYVRFDSVFDFGTNYQLTVNDMGHLGFKISAGVVGLVQYLLYYPILSWQFPFVGKAINNFIYYGYLYNERLVGGIIFLSPIALFAFTLPIIKKYIKFNSKNDKEIYNSAVLIILISYVLIFVISAMGGILQRYAADFTYLYNIAAIIIFLLLYSNLENKKLKSFIVKILFVCMLFTMFINLMSGTFIAEDENFIALHNTTFFYLKSILSFWE